MGINEWEGTKLKHSGGALSKIETLFYGLFDFLFGLYKIYYLNPPMYFIMTIVF